MVKNDSCCCIVKKSSTLSVDRKGLQQTTTPAPTNTSSLFCAVPQRTILFRTTTNLSTSTLDAFMVQRWLHRLLVGDVLVY